MENFKEFTNLEKTTKTIKMSLIPQGKTLEYLHKQGILDDAVEQNQKKNALKEYISDYYRYIIDNILDAEYLKQYVKTDYLKMMHLNIRGNYKEVTDEKINVYEALIKQLATAFSKHPLSKKTEPKLLITKILTEYYKNNEDALELLDYFSNKTTRMKTFIDTKNKIFEDEEKAGNLVTRIMKDNMPKYMNNYNIYCRFIEMLYSGKMAYKEAENDFNELCNYLSAKEIDISPENYISYMKQKGIELYNTVLGGVSLENGSKIKGLNEIINTHNQKCVKKEDKLSLFTPLYKQIMAKTSTFSAIDNNPLKSHKELAKAVTEYSNFVADNKAIIIDLLTQMDKYDASGVYINKSAFGNISNFLFKKAYIIYNAIENEYDDARSDVKKNKDYNDAKKKALNAINAYSLQKLNDLIYAYAPDQADITVYYHSITSLMDKFEMDYEVFKDFKDVNYRTNNEAIMSVKTVLEDLLAINRMLKTLSPNAVYENIDVDFYSKLEECQDIMSDAYKIYNKARNFITKKDFDNKSIQVDFNFNTFMQGWASMTNNGATILMKDDKYYLAVLNTSERKSLTDAPAGKKDSYKIMQYKNLDVVKQLPRIYVAQVKQFLGDYPEFTERHAEVAAISAKKKSNKNYKYTYEDQQTLISYYHDVLIGTGMVNQYGIDMMKAEEYTGATTNGYPLVEFFNDIQRQVYSIEFNNIDAGYVDRLVEEGRIFLFQIYNKDFSSSSYGNPSLFTLYWKALFDERNLANPVYQLLGNGVVTYRKKSIDNPFVHKKGEKVLSKTEAAVNKERVFEYDIIKNKRYTYNHFEMHITININKNGDNLSTAQFNRMVDEYIQKNHDDMHVIGLTRGNKNLIYYTVTDLKGKVVEHGSLNKLQIGNVNNQKTVDYFQKLADREKEIEIDQKTWQSEYSIKDLKTGYVSQVIPKVCDLMIKYNAILVLEDLSGDLKIKGKSLEKGIYTDFENAILSKLNLYINDKNFNHNTLGSVFNGYQLTPLLETKGNMNPQQGFVFFVNVGNTENMDPSTGFVDKLGYYENRKKDLRKYLRCITDITYKNGLYYFKIDYSQNSTIDTKGVATKWTLNSNGIRYYYYRNKDTNNKWKAEEVKITDRFTEIFDEYGIDINSNILDQIYEVDKLDLYQKFAQNLKLMLKYNNSMDGNNFYISPVDGSIFNKEQVDPDFISSYNIARKGTMIMERILNADMSGKKLPSSLMTTEEWVDYSNKHLVTKDML